MEVAQRNIEAAGNRLRLFHDGDTLLGCLQMVIAPGHTPGHSIIRIFSDNEELYHIADVVHSEILSFEHPEWIYNSDTDYSVAIETRKEVLGRMADAKRCFCLPLAVARIGLRDTRGKGIRVASPKGVDAVLILITTNI